MNKQIIVCAACKVYGIVLCGARHWDNIMGAQIDALNPYIRLSIPRDEEQGFIDNFGKFLTREEAMAVVKENGQPFDIDRNVGDVVLFSEGLY